MVLQAAILGAFHFHQGLGGFLITGTARLGLGLVWLAAGRNLWPGILLHGIVNSPDAVMPGRFARSAREELSRIDTSIRRYPRGLVNSWLPGRRFWFARRNAVEASAAQISQSGPARDPATGE